MKLEFSRHQSKLQSVAFTFDLLRWALKELSEAGFRRHMESLRKQKDAKFKTAIKFFSADPDFVLVPDLEKHHKRSLSAELPVTPSLKWAENKGHAQLALNASELVLRVALFEAFLKEIHHHVLLAQPKLLAYVKPNRSVSLKDLFRTGFEQFLCEEAHRQVREADRFPTKERAKFFHRRLRLRWGDETTIEHIHQLINIRHDLVHSTPDRPVLDKDIQDSRQLFRAVTSTCFYKACDLYPSHFYKPGTKRSRS